MKERACKNCHLITKNEQICPKCKTHSLSDDYTGEVIVIKPEENLSDTFLNKKSLRFRTFA